MVSSLTLEDRIKLLALIFRRYESWAQRRGYVCRPGCASCCTTKVTMTELEGEWILASLAGKGKTLPVADSDHAPSWRPGLTANQLAGCCMRGVWPEQEEGEDAEHPAARCRFLETDGQCSIYTTRPLACRVMASSIDCRREGCAEVPAVHITISAALSQIVEHLDQGNSWGNMDDILRCLRLDGEARMDYRQRRLLQCEPSPGWLIPEGEGVAVVSFLQGLFAARIEGRSVGEALGLEIIV